MKRAYLILLALILTFAVATTFFARLPARRGLTPVPVQETPFAQLDLIIEGGSLSPQRTTVPKGFDVLLSVHNRDASTVHVELSGYIDRVNVEIDPGSRWEGRFHADRPGDDFAWLVNGEPIGRLHVTGSHLVEGHR